MDRIRKLHTGEFKQAGDETIFVISDGQKDRDGDTIDPMGWDFSEFMKNPVVLWAHDNKVPAIGRASRVWRDGNNVKASIKFASTPFAREIAELCKGGFLNATSVGFLPTNAKHNNRGGQDFSQQSLMEISIVNVPSNARALVSAREAGILTEKVFQYLSGDSIALELEDDYMKDYGRSAGSANGNLTFKCPRGTACPIEVGQAISTCPGTSDAIMGGEKSCPFHGWAPVGTGGNPVEAVGATNGSVPGVGDVFGNPPKGFKSGRRVSALTAAILKEAHRGIADAHILHDGARVKSNAALKCLKSLTGDESYDPLDEEDDEESPEGVQNPRDAKSIAVRLAPDVPAHEKIAEDINAAMLAEILSDSIAKGIKETISSEIDRAIRKMRGRAD